MLDFLSNRIYLSLLSSGLFHFIVTQESVSTALAG